MKVRATLFSVLWIALGLTTASEIPAQNAVADWHTVLESNVAGSGRKNAVALPFYAYVDVAMYDAVASINHRYEPFAVRVRAPRGASEDAAAASAAHDVLVHYLPSQATTLDAALATSLALIPDGPGKTEIAVEEVLRTHVFCDDWEQASHAGELMHAVERGLLTREAVTQLGDVLNGTAAGRRSDDEIPTFDSLSATATRLARDAENGCRRSTVLATGSSMASGGTSLSEGCSAADSCTLSAPISRAKYSQSSMARSGSSSRSARGVSRDRCRECARRTRAGRALAGRAECSPSGTALRRRCPARCPSDACRNRCRAARLRTHLCD